MDRFESDVMDDLMYDAAEGPTQDLGFDEYDEYDPYDEGDEGDDEFLGRILGGLGGLIGGGAGQFDEYDEYDEYDEGDEYDDFEAADPYDEYDEYDPMEDLVADALDSDDADEFFKRLAGIAKRVGRGIGSVARTVAPIASMIPLPQAQLIGRIAGVAGKMLADGADDFEAFDDLVDGMDEDGIDAAAPVLAGMLVRRAVPAITRAPAPVRKAAVKGVTKAVRKAVRRQGPPAAKAVARAVRATRRVVQARRIPPHSTHPQSSVR